jgi:hypothetical protein
MQHPQNQRVHGTPPAIKHNVKGSYSPYAPQSQKLRSNPEKMLLCLAAWEHG